MNTATSFPVFGLRRRHLLGGVLAAGALASLRWTDALADPAPASFMALSAYLTERDQLDPAIGARLLAAMTALDANAGQKLDALWQWISTEKVALAELHQRIQAEQGAFAGLTAAVMQAWYQGIVGSGQQARAVVYEYALNAQVVADQLRPPSYAYGGYGSWSANPAQITLSLNRLR